MDQVVAYPDLIECSPYGPALALFTPHGGLIASYRFSQRVDGKGPRERDLAGHQSYFRHLFRICGCANIASPGIQSSQYSLRPYMFQAKCHAISFGEFRRPSVPSLACSRPVPNWFHAFIADSTSSSCFFSFAFAQVAPGVLSGAGSITSVPHATKPIKTTRLAALPLLALASASCQLVFSLCSVPGSYPGSDEVPLSSGERPIPSSGWVRGWGQSDSPSFSQVQRDLQDAACFV